MGVGHRVTRSPGDGGGSPPRDGSPGHPVTRPELAVPSARSTTPTPEKGPTTIGSLRSSSQARPRSDRFCRIAARRRSGPDHVPDLEIAVPWNGRVPRPRATRLPCARDPWTAFHEQIRRRARPDPMRARAPGVAKAAE